MKWTRSRRERKGSTDHAEDAVWIATILEAKSRGEVQEAYRRLMQKYWQVVTVLTTRKLQDVREAEDVAQEAFVRAFQALGRLKEPTAFLGWLLQIARNMATDRLRTRKNTVSLDRLGDSAAEAAATAERGASTPEYELELETREDIEEVLQAVDTLPDHYREVITLRYLRDLDGRTMAKLLGEPEGTVRNRLFRALAKLREILQPKATS